MEALLVGVLLSLLATGVADANQSSDGSGTASGSELTCFGNFRETHPEEAAEIINNCYGVVDFNQVRNSMVTLCNLF